MDISKISPAPWRYDCYSNDIQIGDGTEAISKIVVNGEHDNAYSGEETMSVCDAEFIALARNAFDVMMRRKWLVQFVTEPCANDPGPGWQCLFNGFYQDPDECELPGGFKDPFTALVEADKWFKENVGE